MKTLEGFLRTATRFDAIYTKGAMRAIARYSDTDETAERRIAKYLSKQSCSEFCCTNAVSRQIFRRELIVRALSNEKLYGAEQAVMLATFADDKWAERGYEPSFDLPAAKQKVRNALKGIDFIGAFEPGVYTSPNPVGSTISFHAHLVVWGSSVSELRRHKKTIEHLFEALPGDERLSFPVLNQIKSAEGLYKAIRYVTKMPVDGYLRVPGPKGYTQRVQKISDLDYYYLVARLQRHSVFDMWFASGVGVTLLREATRGSKRVAHRYE
jgi:hypothetical protein